MKNCIRLVAPIILMVTIVVGYPATAFAQTAKTKLNESAFGYAQEVIAQGNTIIDKRNDWGEHRPTIHEENDFIRAHGLPEYAKWHLGIDASHAASSKARYKFPFGDFKNIHRCALLAVRSRAHQFGYSDIENAAQRLLAIMESKQHK